MARERENAKGGERGMGPVEIERETWGVRYREREREARCRELYHITSWHKAPLPWGEEAQ